MAFLLITVLDLGFLLAPAPAQNNSTVNLDGKVTIQLSDTFNLSLTFGQYPNLQFNLWLPEIGIFDSDLDRAHLSGPLQWEKNDQGNLWIKGKLGEGKKVAAFEIKLKPLSESALNLQLTVRNIGQSPWSDYSQLAVCLAPGKGSSSFSDQTGENTFVLNNDKITPITRLGPVDSFNHYPVGLLSDPNDSLQRHRVSNGFVARENADGNASIAFFWDKSARVDVNPGGLDCIHSHPSIGPLIPGEALSRVGYIFIESDGAMTSFQKMKELSVEY